MDRMLRGAFFHLYRGVSSSDYTSASLGRGRELDLEIGLDGTSFPFPMLESGTVSVLLLALASSVPRMRTP
jgi:hypothetical protein